MRKYRDYSDEDLIKAVKNNVSMAGALRELDLKVAGGNYDHLRYSISRLSLDTSHFTGQLWSKGKILKEWGNYTKNVGRKKVLIEERGHKCEDCGLTEWKENPIILELHHVDGNRINNEKSNLQLLCCNCHAFTDNWRNKKRK